jgi:N-acetylneuraminic acid mutarotase
MRSVGTQCRWLGSEHLLPNPHSIVTQSCGLSPRVRSQCAGVALFAVALVLAGTGCGGGSTHTAAGPRAAARTDSSTATAQQAALARPAQLVYHPLYSLPAPLRDSASAVLGSGHFVLLGGLDAADSSSAGIELADLHGVLHTVSLPLAQHDAQGVQLGGVVYVFGGGSFSELDHIVSFDPVHDLVHSAGVLPRAQSDVAVTSSDGTAYVVGGYDGTNWLDTILAWRPGSAARVVAHLPVGLRYAAASSVDGQVLIIGGSTPAGASDSVYRLNPATGRVRQIGRLPQPITHAGAATLGSFVYLVGGRGGNLDSQTADVWSINPLDGAVRPAGRLPEPLSDTGVMSTGGALVVAGGLSPTGTQAGVGELVPIRPR